MGADSRFWEREFGGRWEQSGVTAGAHKVVEKLSLSRFHNPLGFSSILTTLNVYSLSPNDLHDRCRYEYPSFVGILYFLISPRAQLTPSF